MPQKSKGIRVPLAFQRAVRDYAKKHRTPLFRLGQLAGFPHSTAHARINEIITNRQRYRGVPPKTTHRLRALANLVGYTGDLWQ